MQNDPFLHHYKEKSPGLVEWICILTSLILFNFLLFGGDAFQWSEFYKIMLAALALILLLYFLLAVMQPKQRVLSVHKLGVFWRKRGWWPGFTGVSYADLYAVEILPSNTIALHLYNHTQILIPAYCSAGVSMEKCVTVIKFYHKSVRFL
jgi:hypothetical protein